MPTEVQRPGASGMMEGSELQVGAIVGNQFRLERKLGEGGMGELFVAQQLEVERPVAIKVVHGHLVHQHPQLIERFKREARAIAQLNHPHVVQLHMYGATNEGRPFLAMEYIPGRTLAAEISQAPLPAERALRIARQVAEALAEAHRRGIVHRDLKPENIMLARVGADTDFVKVVDFGIAKVLGPGDDKLTQTGSFFGTPQYMAPEQARSHEVNARTDIYALGVVLYEMLTGDVPFTGKTPFDVLSMHVNNPPSPPSVRRPGVSAALDSLVLRCLAKDPVQRFASAEALIEAVDACGIGGGPAALPETQELPRDALPQAEAGAASARLPSAASPAHRATGTSGEATASTAASQQPDNVAEHYKEARRLQTRGVLMTVGVVVAWLVVMALMRGVSAGGCGLGP